MSYYTPYKIGVYVSVSPSSGQKGKGQNLQKSERAKNRKCRHFPAIYCLIYAIFSGKGVSRDVERKGEVKNGLTSCLARQTEVPAFSCL